VLVGLCDTDTNCSRFLDKCMPEAFNKVSEFMLNYVRSRNVEVILYCAFYGILLNRTKAYFNVC
jgi:hypothetical protein